MTLYQCFSATGASGQFFIALTLYVLIQATDGGMISKPKGLAPLSSNVTKSTSALPPATKNTSNKNDEINKKMKKVGSSTAIPDPRKRLMVEETKGKVSQTNEVYMCMYVKESMFGEGEKRRGR